MQKAAVNSVEEQIGNVAKLDLNETPAAYASKRWSHGGVSKSRDPGLDGSIHLPLKDDTAS